MSRKHTFRKIGISLALIVSVAGIISLTILLPRPVSAGTPYEDCLNNSGAPDVEAVVGACNSCFGNTSNGEFGIARGALWLGSRDSDVTTITKGTTTVPMTLWGTVYSCTQTGSGANPASHIWFASAGSIIGNSAAGMLNNAVDFLSPNNATLNMARGNGQGAANTWSSPPGSRSGITLDVEKFKNYSGTTEEVFERDGKTVHRYTATVSINRCYGNPGSYYNMSGLRNQACYGDDSRIVIEEVEENPPDIPDPVPVEGQGWTADVEVTVLGRDGIEDHTVTSAKDLQAVIAVSADEAFQVRFKHTMYFTPSPGPWQEGHDGKEVEDSCTNWTVTTTNGSGGSGVLCADSVTGAIKGNPVIIDETITLAPGDNSRNWAMSINNYGPKSYTYPLTWEGDWHTCGSGQSAHPCWKDDKKAIYSAVGSGSGSAGGAVSAVKPKDPEGNVQVGNSNPFIFTGQETAVSWGVTGTGWYERRIMSTQSPIYQVDDWADRSGGIANNKEREYSYDPCGYWIATQPGVIACLTPVGTNAYEDAQVKAGIPTITANPAGANFQVPDNVGDKFCTTYGYHWQYYWAHGENFSVGSQPTEEQFSNWAKEGGSKSLYWFIFGSSCRAIVKKPTVALWNGGLLTNGGVSVSLATRYWPNASFGALAGQGGTRSFSSWTEYLGVINGGVTNFGTGASYARGATGITNPLTIANRNGDGGSGILTSSTFRTRLDTYLRTAASNSITEMYDRSNNDNSTMITVLSDPSGTNWITENIKVDGKTQINGSYDSIYQLPQNVIFVDGNLNITPDVTRIDAWLIVNGELNTCPSFVSGLGGTQTAPASGICDKQLIFNGPVLANTLTLNRTYGADPVLQGSQYVPAEVFNLSADSYLWAYAQAGRYGSSYTESYSRELAPRY